MANKKHRISARDMERYHRYGWHRVARATAWLVIMFVVLCVLSAVR